jgi:hypothetical protein
MLNKAAMLFLNGEPETARIILRDLVNATAPSVSRYSGCSCKASLTALGLRAITVR